MNIEELKEIARLVRGDVIEMVTRAGSGHPGGSLSVVEVLVTLYYEVMHHDPQNPDDDDRDRLVLSKGHAAPTLYAILSRLGYFDREWLLSLRRCGSKLQGHPYAPDTPGVDASSGSLGQGLSFANGCAMRAKLDNKSYRVYCIIGDGETNEGQIWEASMTSARYGLDNLCCVLDYNKLQIDGRIEDIKNPLPFRDKWEAFGWSVLDVNGHSFGEIKGAFDEATKTKGKPTMILAHTVKGKGVSFMEGKFEWHGRAPTRDEADRALRELGFDNGIAL
ncbi:transketolase [candidate division WOR-3 bacterium JGI_Cruoil_03_44_89]|uniref:Transketolase n=1 Tax=candidate division WOR-3 bacterium JGI_Cruoil_03_44_89 TaxID=1973748 RepID=A0A235BPD8_UNCW3|nr:MAG: transketolase [candidate division WOR-3 bacterium JGI_Cruoil_03_44_89]